MSVRQRLEDFDLTLEVVKQLSREFLSLDCLYRDLLMGILASRCNETKNKWPGQNAPHGIPCKQLRSSPSQ